MFTEDCKWHRDYVQLAHDTGFCFDKHKSDNFDKDQISLVDIDRVIDERDFATIEKFIPTITKFVLDRELSRILDTSFVKTFRLCQLTIQYLLFCKKHVDNSWELAKASVKKLEEENRELNLFVDDLKEHIAQLMREIDERCSYKCEQCTKMFSTQEFLNSHIKRRHSTPNANTETDKLQLEIKELKGRLNSAEQLICKEQSLEVRNNESRRIEELQQRFEDLRLQVQAELKVLQTQHSYHDKIIEKIAQPSHVELNQRRESATQTDIAVAVQDHQNTASLKFVDKENIQEITNEKDVPPFEDVLEAKVSTSLDRIEKQMQTFWNKLSEIESVNKNSIETRQKSDIELSKLNTISRISKVNNKYAINKFEKTVNRKSNYIEDTQTKEKPYLFEKFVKTNNFAEDKQTDQRQCSVDNLSKPVTKNDITKRKKAEILEEQTQQSNLQMSVAEEQDTLSSATITSEAEVAAGLNNKDFKPLPVPAPRKHSLPSTNALDEVLLQKSRTKIENKIRERLQDLGVSPDWTGLPIRSFQRAMEIVNHQASLTKKSYPNFDFISSKIARNIDEKLHDTKKNPKQKGVKREQQRVTKVEKQQLKTSPRIEIKYRSIYETDSESEVKPVPVTERLKEFSVPYSAVIEELKSVTTNKNDVVKPDEEKLTKDVIISKNEEQTKGVLKSYPSVTKKKVIFNLDTDEDDGKNLSIKNEDSSTSMASSVLDGTPRNHEHKPNRNTTKREKDIEDLSDFDFSDI